MAEAAEAGDARPTYAPYLARVGEAEKTMTAAVAGLSDPALAAAAAKLAFSTTVVHLLSALQAAALQGNDVIHAEAIAHAVEEGARAAGHAGHL